MAADPAGATALRDLVAARAAAVDAATEDPRRALEQVAADGLLALGAPGRAGTIADQAAVITQLAEGCLASAFCAWGHRMALEYLAPAGGPHVEPLAHLQRIGSSAMASAFKARLGLAPLPVTARRDGDGLVLDGRIAWASNLHADAIAVLAVAVEGEGEGETIVALPLERAGVDVRPARNLLALEATASGQLSLDGVRVEAHDIHPEPFRPFVDRVRRPFLALQTAFCVGLTQAALTAAGEHLQGLGLEFADDVARLGATRDDVAARLAALADDETAPAGALVRLRLDAAVLAREAVRVEAAVTGGRGYVASSPTARRLREAAFLPVQSPTEAQLRWELRQSA